MVCLSHTQYRTPILIQIADIFGAYTLTFVISLVSVGITAAINLCIAKRPNETASSLLSSANLKRQNGLSIAVASLALIAALLYGWVKLGENAELKKCF